MRDYQLFFMYCPLSCLAEQTILTLDPLMPYQTIQRVRKYYKKIVLSQFNFNRVMRYFRKRKQLVLPLCVGSKRKFNYHACCARFKIYIVNDKGRRLQFKHYSNFNINFKLDLE